MKDELLNLESLSTNEKLIELLSLNKTGMLVFDLDNLKMIVAAININGKIFVSSKMENKSNIVAYETLEDLERLTNIDCISKQINEAINQYRNISISACKLKAHLTDLIIKNSTYENSKVLMDTIDFVCEQNEFVINERDGFKKSIIIADDNKKEASDLSDLHLQLVETTISDGNINKNYPSSTAPYVLRAIDKSVDEKYIGRLKILKSQEKKTDLKEKLMETYMGSMTK